MARSRGRQIVAKVDDNGNKIKGKLSIWIKKNPGRLYFDSMVEYEVWKYVEDTKVIKMDDKITLELFTNIQTEEYKAPRRTKKAIREGRTDKQIVNTTQQNIEYTPDYYLPDYDTYIEVKGYADELFKLRWKLFKLKGYKGFIVYSLEEFKNLINELSEK